MKLKKCLAACLAAAVGLTALAGCSQGQSLKLANEMTFSLDSVLEVAISYDEEEVAFYESKDGALTVREYMTENKSSYHARVEQGGGVIQISEGGKPFFKGGFSRCVEVYLPASYHEALTVSTTDGGIDLSCLEISLNALCIDSTSGRVRLGAAQARTIQLSTTSGILDAGCLDAERIRIDTTSGSFSCEKLNGDVTYTTTSGDADIQSAVGSGSYRANNSGRLNVTYTGVTGGLSFFNKNDSISVTLPADLEFEFEAAAKNGSISTTFQEYIAVEDGVARGTVGGDPAVTVKMETNNGNIEVRK